MAMVGLLTALPTTQLGRRLAREGRMREASSGNNTHDLTMNFEPIMPVETLIAGYKRVLQSIYRPWNYFRRCATLVRRLPPRATSVHGVSLNEVKALLRSLFRQGLSSYGPVYLSFLANVLVRRPRRFPDAVALAVKGYHLFAITSEIRKADRLQADLRRETARAERRLQRRLEVLARRSTARLGSSTSRAIVRLSARMSRRYERLSVGMQQYVEEAFAEFWRTCQGWLAQFRTDG
jgi:hypothetical protein